MKVAIVLACLGAAAPASAEPARQYAISFQSLALKHGERVVGLDIQIGGAHVVQANGVPAGWTVLIDNDPSGKTEVRGNALVGAAALDATDLAHLLRIESQPGVGTAPPSVSGEVIVTTDFEHERRIPLSGKAATIKPIK